MLFDLTTEMLLTKSGIQHCKARSILRGMDINKGDMNCAESVADKLYREIVGSLIYVMIAT